MTDSASKAEAIRLRNEWRIKVRDALDARRRGRDRAVIFGLNSYGTLAHAASVPTAFWNLGSGTLLWLRVSLDDPPNVSLEINGGQLGTHSGWEERLVNVLRRLQARRLVE